MLLHLDDECVAAYISATAALGATLHLRHQHQAVDRGIFILLINHPVPRRRAQAPLPARDHKLQHLMNI